MLARIVETLEAQGATNADMPCLNSLAYGGGKMPLSVIEKAMTLFPETDFSNAYGLTETSSTICVLGPDAHRDAVASTTEAGRRRLVSVGQALPGVEIEIRDDKGRVLGAGERGEIYVRGEQVSGEYEGKGSVVDADGWFPTRDAGSMDDEGFLFLEGVQTMSSCAAGRIYRRVKLKMFCSLTLMSPMLRLLAYPMNNGAKLSLRPWWQRPVPASTSRRSKIW